MSFDFLLDNDGDLALDETGDLIPITTIEHSHKQRLQIRLGTNRGEWVFDTSYGVPYLNEIIGGKLRSKEVDAVIRAEASKEEGVVNLFDFKSEYNPIIRKHSLSFKSSTDSGPLSIELHNDEYTPTEAHPEPSNEDIRVTCGLVDIVAFSNELYPIVHFQIPIGGTIEWDSNFVNDETGANGLTGSGIGHDGNGDTTPQVIILNEPTTFTLDLDANATEIPMRDIQGVTSNPTGLPFNSPNLLTSNPTDF